jgi:outer membrane lipoprotein-sorting protein
MLAVAALAGEAASPPALTAIQIVDKNVAARGGLDAWRKVKTMVWIGHLESANPAEEGTAFDLAQKRPDKTRFELANLQRKTMHVFDGARGWKVTAPASGRPELKPYTPQELQFAKEAQGIDGPLIDYRAKGNTVALEGTDDVDGRLAYRLKVTLPSGESHHVWVDAKTFLDVKYDRTSYDAKGFAGTVSVESHDYKAIQGLQIPMTLEIGAGSGKVPDRMVIDKVELNVPLPDRLFAEPSGLRPGMPMAARQAVPAAGVATTRPAANGS